MDIADKAGEKPQHLVLRVRYLAAHRPYVEPQASPGETLASVKPRVLSFFGLVEGPKVYSFVKDGEALNLSATLGQLADGKHELKLDLAEQLEQG